MRDPSTRTPAEATTGTPAVDVAATLAEMEQTLATLSGRVVRVCTVLDSVAHDVVELLIRSQERDELTRAILRHPAGRRPPLPVTPVTATS